MSTTNMPDLRPHLTWALRRISFSLGEGEHFFAAQAALDSANAAPTQCLHQIQEPQDTAQAALMMLPDERAAFERWIGGANLKRTQFDDYENDYVDGKWSAWQARAALAATPAQAVASSITIDFKQAAELLEMFGGEPAEITLMTGDGHSGDGLYALYTEIPEEGANFLGASDNEAEPAAPAQEAAPALEAPAAPAGWKLVPVQDTPSMWTAGGEAIKSCGGHERDAASLAYKAMLAAAPQAPAAPVAERINAVMRQAQVFASAWSLVGGIFDKGQMLAEADDAEAELLALVIAAFEAPAAPAVDAPAPAAQPVASIYITEDGGREFDDWRVSLPVGRNELYAAPQAPTEDAREAVTVPSWALVELLREAKGLDDGHVFRGLCPEASQPDSRDDECECCRAIDAAIAAQAKGAQA